MKINETIFKLLEFRLVTNISPKTSQNLCNFKFFVIIEKLKFNGSIKRIFNFITILSFPKKDNSMGYISFLQYKNQEFSIDACHINLWVLNGFFKQRFFLDIGLAITVKCQDNLEDFSITLPFKTEKNIFQDLRGVFDGKRVKPLLMMRSDKEGKVKVNDKDYYLSSVSGTKDDKQYKDENYSRWNIKLGDNIANEKDIYLRLRFSPQNLGSIWKWNSKRHGMVADLRFSDLQEVNVLHECANDEDSIVKIEKIFAFIVLPMKFFLKDTDPHLTYKHSLKITSWKDYLLVKPSLFRREEFMIYSWRKLELTEPLSPFRIFADYSKTSQQINYIYLYFMFISAFIIAYELIDFTKSPTYNDPFAYIQKIIVVFIVPVGSLLPSFLRFIIQLQFIVDLFSKSMTKIDKALFKEE